MSAPPIRLLGNRILVKLDDESEFWSGTGAEVKIHRIGDKDSHVFRTGVVVKLGPGDFAPKSKERIPIDLNIGSKVLFVKFAATHTKTAQSIQGIVGKDYAIISLSDVLLEVSPEFNISRVSQ